MPFCPDREQLDRFLNDQLAEADDAQVAQHIDHCPICQQALEELTASKAAAASALPNRQDLPSAGWLDRMIAVGPTVPVPSRAAVDGPLAAPPSQVGAYQLLRELGRGGMGVVHVARHTSLDRLVALKMILGGEHAGASALVRFRAEAETLARLQHPNIVQVHDVGEHAGQPFLVMEYVAGGNLDDFLKGQPQPAQCAAELLVPLAEALEAAHRAGIVHRDLKPANILLSFSSEPPKDASVMRAAAPRWRDATAGTLAVNSRLADVAMPKITDFGLAKRLDGASPLTVSGLVVGTPSYMAPEQAGGQREFSPASDVWALGAILYECLTGRPPFLGETNARTVLQVLNDDPVPPQRLQSSVPRDLETICLKCLEKEPKRRYASAQALADDLQRYLRGEPIRARPARPWEIAWKWARRKPTAASLLAVLLLAAIIGFPGVMALWLRADRERDRATAAQGEPEYAVYAGHMVLAQRAYQDNDVTSARSLLDKARPAPGRPDLRGWEWSYLHRLCQADLHPNMRHSRPGWNFMNSLAVSPDGRRAVTAVGLVIGQSDPQGRDRIRSPGEVCIWDLDTGRCLRSCSDHPGAIDAVAISPDGRILATGGAQGSVRLLDLETGKSQTGPPPVPGNVYGLAFAPGGRDLAIASDAALIVWNSEAGKARFTITHKPLWYLPRLAFRPDGRLLLAVAPGVNGVRAWDAENGTEVSVPLPDEPAQALAFSPDGRLLALARGKEIEVWDAAGWRLLRRLAGHTLNVEALAFAPDGRLASASDDRSIRVWDATTGREVIVLRGHTGGVTCLEFASKGRRLVAGDKEMVVKVWDVTRDPQGHVFHATSGDQLGEWLSNLVFAADGRTLWVVREAGNVATERRGPYRLYQWDVAEPHLIGEKPLNLLAKIPGHAFRDFVFSADGSRLAASPPLESGAIRVWDSASGAEIRTIATSASSVSAADLSADGQALVYRAWSPGPEKGPVRAEVVVVATATGEVRRRIELPPGRMVASACLRLDGRLLAAAEVAVRLEGTSLAPEAPWHIILWEVASGREQLRLAGVEISARPGLVFSPDGSRLAAVDGNGTVQVWDVATGQPAFPTLRAGAGLTGLAYSSDGRRLAAAGLDDRVRLYDAVAGHPLLELRCLGVPGTGHYGFTARVAFSPDGRRLAANGWDGSVTIWTDE